MIDTIQHVSSLIYHELQSEINHRYSVVLDLSGQKGVRVNPHALQDETLQRQPQDTYWKILHKPYWPNLRGREWTEMGGRILLMSTGCENRRAKLKGPGEELLQHINSCGPSRTQRQKCGRKLELKTREQLLWHLRKSHGKNNSSTAANSSTQHGGHDDSNTGSPWWQRGGAAADEVATDVAATVPVLRCTLIWSAMREGIPGSMCPSSRLSHSLS